MTQDFKKADFWVKLISFIFICGVAYQKHDNAVEELRVIKIMVNDLSREIRHIEAKQTDQMGRMDERQKSLQYLIERNLRSNPSQGSLLQKHSLAPFVRNEPYGNFGLDFGKQNKGLN